MHKISYYACASLKWKPSDILYKSLCDHLFGNKVSFFPQQTPGNRLFLLRVESTNHFFF